MRSDRINVRDQISANRRNSFILMLLVPAVIVVLISVIGMAYNPDAIFTFLIGGIIFSMAFTIGSYYYSDKIVLSISCARPATKAEHAHLVNSVEGLAIAAGIPAPKIFVLDSPDMNAFATGRDPEHGIIVVTTGIMQKLKRDELEGVIAHELSHIKNLDIRFATLVAVLVGIVSIISEIFLRSLWFGGSEDRKGKGNAVFVVLGIALAIIAPIAARLVQLAVSRQREYLADASGALLTRYPEGLASALEKISGQRVTLKPAAAMSHLYFTNPIKKLNAEGLFSTHPPAEERIKRLRAM